MDQQQAFFQKNNRNDLDTIVDGFSGSIDKRCMQLVHQAAEERTTPYKYFFLVERNKFLGNSENNPDYLRPISRDNIKHEIMSWINILVPKGDSSFADDFWKENLFEKYAGTIAEYFGSIIDINKARKEKKLEEGIKVTYPGIFQIAIGDFFDRLRRKEPFEKIDALDEFLKKPKKDTIKNQDDLSILKKGKEERDKQNEKFRVFLSYKGDILEKISNDIPKFKQAVGQGGAYTFYSLAFNTLFADLFDNFEKHPLKEQSKLKELADLTEEYSSIYSFIRDHEKKTFWGYSALDDVVKATGFTKEFEKDIGKMNLVDHLISRLTTERNNIKNSDYDVAEQNQKVTKIKVFDLTKKKKKPTGKYEPKGGDEKTNPKELWLKLPRDSNGFILNKKKEIDWSQGFNIDLALVKVMYSNKIRKFKYLRRGFFSPDNNTGIKFGRLMKRYGGLDNLLNNRYGFVKEIIIPEKPIDEFKNKVSQFLDYKINPLVRRDVFGNFFDMHNLYKEFIKFKADKRYSESEDILSIEERLKEKEEETDLYLNNFDFDVKGWAWMFKNQEREPTDSMLNSIAMKIDAKKQ